MEIIQSVGIVVFKDNKVLLVRHGEEATHHTGVVGIPSGRLDENETHIQCAVRELLEESGLVTTEDQLLQLPHVYRATIDSKKGPRTFDWVVFYCKNYSGELKGSYETEPFWEEITKVSTHKPLPNVTEAIEKCLKFL